jgi:hypothetical protein
MGRPRLSQPFLVPETFTEALSVQLNSWLASLPSLAPLQLAGVEWANRKTTLDPRPNKSSRDQTFVEFYIVVGIFYLKELKSVLLQLE